MISGTYRDFLGRAWPEHKLDAVLDDPETRLDVMAGASRSLRPNGTWDAEAVQFTGELRFARPEAVALFVVLVERYFDGLGSHLLKRRGAR